ncbi:AMP-dependent synthetase [Pandoraea pnomenusa]|uniref:AMP-dependent synthetase n=1 Tax=Pandoraea pnomenusa TaxID=93220 RepID=A0ABY6WJ17_9BURK|nr:AMP-binding protein [Pandoraea pnomenusa]AHB04141.1 AMP-dependent synthetase [Pandoraea pnomenusa 3kgm]VVE65879.1 AMP-dependent synthetase [Pandoraea pnomenusa]
MNIANTLARAAQRYPDHIATYLGDTPLHDYATLARRCARLAAGLRSMGLADGARVALWMRNRPEYLEWLYAIWWAGLVAVPINAKLHPREAAFIVGDAAADILLAQADDLQSIAEFVSPSVVRMTPEDSRVAEWLQVEASQGSGHSAGSLRPGAVASRENDDMAWIFYTSGTTGRPKGVMLSHRNLWSMAACYLTDVDTPGREDRTLYAAPMSHGAGLYSVIFMMQAAGHVFPASGGFDAQEMFALAASLGNISCFAAPTMVNRLVRHAQATGAKSDGFRTLVYGGGPMYAADIERALSVMGPRFVQIYGQGESPMTITVLPREAIAASEHPRWASRLASVGHAHAMVEVVVVDDDGEPVAAGTPGEVVVRGDVVMQGYWRNPEATAKTLRDGWLWTGDIGVLDDDGYLTLKDRSKDVIISGGTNIYPREVEEVLLRADGVAEVAVIGEPDAEWGEVVVAYVVCTPGDTLDSAALDAFCLAHIARFKRPKRYVALDALPKNHYGKVLKTALRSA